MRADFPPADGFDFPIGDADGKGSYVDRATGKRHDGWLVATEFGEEYSLGIHPGEDWNGGGGGATDRGQPVRAIGNGRVVTAAGFGSLWGNVIVIEHLFYENHERRIVRSVYAHLDTIIVSPGEIVSRRQQIGTIGADPEGLFSPHLHLEVRSDTALDPTYWPSTHGRDVAWVREHYLDPREFIGSHRTLPVPQDEKRLVLIDHESMRIRIYSNGKITDELDVAFGQAEGRKRLKGDNRTPKGMYFVIGKERGDFGGEYGDFYGGHWIEINYPNPYDAAWGRAEGHITEKQEAEIARRWLERKETPQNTPLGSGIGLHGWASEWPNDGPRRLSWGCVVLHNRDVARFYDETPIGTMIVLL